MDDKLLTADRQAREDALDVSRSFIVQAPAGSGKTELLIQRYLRLLSVVDEPEQIIAITFTRKAASEMRHRVIDALRAARHGIDGAEGHRRTTRLAAHAALKRDGQLGWQLVAAPHRMRIQTLDAFNAGIVRSLPISSGLGGIGRTVADAEMQAVYKQAAAAAMDWLPSADAIGDAAEAVLDHLDNSAAVFVSYISRMLQSRDQWLAFIGSGPGEDADYRLVRDRLERGISDILAHELQRADRLLPDGVRGDLVELLAYAASNLPADESSNRKSDSGKSDELVTALRELDGFPRATPAELTAWQAMAQLLLIKSGAIRKTVNKNQGFPSGDSGQKAGFIALLDELRELDGLDSALHRVSSLPSPRYSDAQWAVLVALLRLLPVAVAELRRIFDERSVCDHVEVALAASAALGSSDDPGDIAMMLDHRIRHLLVDEMQDTSLGQYRLLRQLTAGWAEGDGRTLFCVGDPMQSIYRFRDAEVGQFILAQRDGIGSVRPECRLLRRNFRSGENLVHWFNTVFSQTMPFTDDIAAGAIAYAESVPVEMHAGTGDARLHPLIDYDVVAESEYAAAVVRDCVEENSGDSTAVLVRSRSHSADLLAALRRLNVPYEAIEIDRLTDLPEIIDLLALTRALCHDGDRMAWLGLLHGPCAGLSWEDIHRLVMNDARSSIVELLQNRERIGGLSPDGQSRINAFSNTIAEFTAHGAVMKLRDRVERCWYALGGPGTLRDDDELANVYQFLEALEKLERGGTLQDVRELESLLDQEHASSHPGADCRLQIMTMHKSKGLQFDHVVLHALGRGTRANQKSVLSWLTLPGGDENDMIVSPVGSRSMLENDPLHQFIEVTETAKQQHELDRLLYVASTRARRSLHLIGNVNTAASGDVIKGARSGSLLQRLWPAVHAEYERALERRPAGRPATPDSGDLLRQPVSRRYRRGWAPAEAPPLPVRPGAGDRGDVETDRKVEFYWVGTAARHAGTITHRWLQRMTAAGGPAVIGDAAQRRSVSERWARQLGVSDSQIEAVCERVESALERIGADEKGCWLLSGEGQTELPLTGIWKERVVSIVIDRVRVDDDGVHWIVDYKTSTHEGGDLAGFLLQEADRYREQLRKYAAIYSAVTDAPVRTALYFPLLQAFSEV